MPSVCCQDAAYGLSTPVLIGAHGVDMLCCVFRGFSLSGGHYARAELLFIFKASGASDGNVVKVWLGWVRPGFKGRRRLGSSELC